MKISIIIITWNGLHLLKNCLDSLKNLTDRNDVEIIVADNGSNDGTSAFLLEAHPHVQLIELKKNKGVAFARNRALEKASGEYLFILDNDTIASKEAVEGMESFMDTHRQAGICGCRLIDADGLIQESGRKYPGITEKIANLKHGKNYRYAYAQTKQAKAFEPDYLIGACQFIRGEVYRQIGALDEKIFYGPEDADFCIRAKNAGWQIWYLPQYSIIHLCRRMTNKRLLSKMAMKHFAGLLYFYWKHKRLF